MAFSFIFKIPPVIDNYFLTTYGTITSLNTTDSVATPPESIYDQDETTYVDIDNSPLGYVQTELDDAAALQKISLKGHSAGFYGTGLYIYGSNTGAFGGEEVELAHPLESTYTMGVNGRWQSYEWVNTTSYKYYRTVPDNSQPTRISRYEMYDRNDSDYSFNQQDSDQDNHVVAQDRDKTLIKEIGTDGASNTRTKSYITSGKKYFELDLVRGGPGLKPMIGWMDINHSYTNYIGQDASGIAVGWLFGSGVSRYYHDGTYTNGNTGDQPTTGDYLMTAVDMATGDVWFGYNGVWNQSGNPATGANPSYTEVEFIGAQIYPAASLYDVNAIHLGRDEVVIRTTAEECVGTIPSGFSALE